MRPSQVKNDDLNQKWIEDCSGTNWDSDAIQAVELEAFTDDSLSSQVGKEKSTQTPSAPRASLGHADLSGCDLRNAELSSADLTKARLRAARLDHANLQNTDLRGADLRGANLQFAQLGDAQLYGAIFNEGTKLPFSKDEAIQMGMIYIEVATEQDPDLT